VANCEQASIKSRGEINSILPRASLYMQYTSCSSSIPLFLASGASCSGGTVVGSVRGRGAGVTVSGCGDESVGKAPATRHTHALKAVGLQRSRRRRKDRQGREEGGAYCAVRSRCEQELSQFLRQACLEGRPSSSLLRTQTQRDTEE
jgi:hypothetical protein